MRQRWIPSVGLVMAGSLLLVACGTAAVDGPFTPDGNATMLIVGQDLDSVPHSVGTVQPEIWQEWFDPFFTWIDANRDVIRSVAYINADWHSQYQWGPRGGNGYWGTPGSA